MPLLKPSLTPSWEQVAECSSRLPLFGVNLDPIGPGSQCFKHGNMFTRRLSAKECFHMAVFDLCL